MNYWLFKVSDQGHYPDEPGNKYVFDNTHSIHVKTNDAFLYLDTSKRYSFTGIGFVKRLTPRNPSKKESARYSKVRIVFVAHLKDVAWFDPPISIKSTLKDGRLNRAKLGIENFLSHGISVSSIDPNFFKAVVDLADREEIIVNQNSDHDFFIDDHRGSVKRRGANPKFKTAVKSRSQGACVVCGFDSPGFHDAHHISPWSDKKNRGNPANGLYLCKFCHRAMDLKLIAIKPTGELLVATSMKSEIACNHFNAISAKDRLPWLKGVDQKLLMKTVEWFDEVNE